MSEHLDYLDQVDIAIARQEEDEEKCGGCGCLLPADGSPCECETGGDDEAD